jgi:molybdopterin converting factor small subunit
MVRAPGAPEGELALDLPEDSRVNSVLAAAGLRNQEPNLLFVIDGRSVDPEAQLREGDLLLILPRLSGG